MSISNFVVTHLTLLTHFRNFSHETLETLETLSTALLGSKKMAVYFYDFWAVRKINKNYRRMKCGKIDTIGTECGKYD